jgi:hypothetical protein
LPVKILLRTSSRYPELVERSDIAAERHDNGLQRLPSRRRGAGQNTVHGVAADGSPGEALDRSRARLARLQVKLA